MPPRAAQPGDPAGARGRRAARAGEGPGAAVRRRRRVHRPRCRTRARARPWSGSASRPTRCPPSRCWRRSATRSPLVAVAAAALLAARRDRGRRLPAARARAARRSPTWSAAARPSPRRASRTPASRSTSRRSQSDDGATTGSRQDPQPGEEADEGSTVTIIVSSGPGQATVPGVVGDKQAEAETGDEGGGLQDRRRGARPPTRSKKGRVIETSPAQARRSSAAATGHARGLRAARSRSRCPTWSATSEDDARSTLEDAGLRVGKSPRRSPRTRIRAPCSSQSPAAGKQVDKGGTVELDGGQGAAGRRGARRGRRAEDEAAQRARGRGLRGARTRGDRGHDRPRTASCSSQRPAAGEERPKGSRVTIVVGSSSRR